MSVQRTANVSSVPAPAREPGRRGSDPRADFASVLDGTGVPGASVRRRDDVPRREHAVAARAEEGATPETSLVAAAHPALEGFPLLAAAPAAATATPPPAAPPAAAHPLAMTGPPPPTAGAPTASASPTAPEGAVAGGPVAAPEVGVAPTPAPAAAAAPPTPPAAASPAVPPTPPAAASSAVQPPAAPSGPVDPGAPSTTVGAPTPSPPQGAPRASAAGVPAGPGAEPELAPAPAAAATPPAAERAPAAAPADAPAPSADPAPAGGAAPTPGEPGPVAATSDAPAPAPAAPAAPAPTLPPTFSLTGVAATAPATAPAAAAPATPVPLPHAAEALGHLLRLAADRGVTHARMALRPAELGGVQIRLQTSSAGVTAQVVADSPEATRLLQGAADELRRSLADAGVTLLGLDVATSGEDRSPAASAGFQAHAEARREHAARSAGRSRGPGAADPISSPDPARTTLELPDGVLVDVLA